MVYDGRTVNEQRPVEGRPPEDAELIARASDGDVAAYEELVTRYQALAFRVAWLVVRHRGEAEDAVQEAFVKAYYALPRFRPGAPFRPWLLRIVANEARNRGRSSRRRDRLTLRGRPRPPGGRGPIAGRSRRWLAMTPRRSRPPSSGCRSATAW